MDEDDLMYAEFIIKALKEKPQNLASTVAQYTYDCHKDSTLKKIFNYDHIFRYLADLSMIEIEYDSTGRGRPQFLRITTIGQNSDSVNSRVRELRYKQYIEQKRSEEEKRNKEIEIEYFKRQNWLAKYWWLTSLFSAIIGVLLGLLVQKVLFC